jgi:PAS domain S-box-containing protein
MIYWSFFHFFCTITYLYLAGYIFIKAPGERFNRSATMMFASMSLWSAGKTLTQMPGMPGDMVFLAENAGAIGWIGFPVAFYHFSAIFAKRERSSGSPVMRIVLWGYFLISLWAQWNGYLVNFYVRRSYGLSLVWGTSLWCYVFLSASAVLILSGLIILLRETLGASSRVRRVQGALLTGSFSAAFIVGSIVDVILPLAGIHRIPQISDGMGLVVAGGVLFSIFRYRFLAITPETAAENIVSHMSDALILLDGEGRMVDTNRAAEELLEVKKFELKGREVSSILADPEVVNLGAGFTDILQSSDIRNLEILLRVKRSEPVEVSFSSSRLKNDEGGLAGIVCIARDISDSKRLERELREANEELRKNESVLMRVNEDLKRNERAVLNILADLKRSHQELKESQDKLLQQAKLASLGKLVSDMAHEVNNPLQIISGRAQISLMEDLGGNEDLETSLNVIKDQCERAKDIIQRLLLFSRPSKREINKVDIRQSLGFVVELVRHQFSLEDVNIIEDYQDELPLVSIDDKQMHEVFMNLLKNAAQAMPEGGDITIRITSDGEKVNIEIQDEGEGISSEDMKKIFDPFFTTKQEGTGLGLSVCYGIVKSHGGELSYSSEPGKGTTARITLPAGELEAEKKRKNQKG